jgi:acyl carrier protein
VSTLEVTSRIERVFTQVFGPRTPFATGLSRLEEPRWNSLKHMEFLVGLEQEFGVRFDGADATDMTSIPEVVERIGNKLA